MDDKVPLYDAYDLIQVDNFRRCCGLCIGLTCTGVYFNQTSQQCLVQRNSMYDPNIKNQTGWIYFLRTVPIYQFPSNDFSYQIYDDIERSHNDSAGYAKSSCEGKGGRLLRIQSFYHLNIVWQFIDWFRSGNYTIIVDGRQHSSDYKWYYNNGEPVQYLEWFGIQPNNNGWQSYGNQTVLGLQWDKRDGFGDFQNYYWHISPLWYICETL